MPLIVSALKTTLFQSMAALPGMNRRTQQRKIGFRVIVCAAQRCARCEMAAASNRSLFVPNYGRMREHSTHCDHQASRRDSAALLTQLASYHLHCPGISGNSSCHLLSSSKPSCGPHLSKSNEKVCKYDRPKHQQTDVAAEIEGETRTKHE